MHDYFDDADNCRKTSVCQTLNRPEARIMIYGDSGGIRIESSLPKLLYGNNLSSVSNAQPALKRLREFTLDYVSGDLPDLDEMRYTRVDYCHNLQRSTCSAIIDNPSKERRMSHGTVHR